VLYLCLQAAVEMQKGWWEVRMIMNEFAMLRSFNPRLLQAGNFGFTDEEMMAALGRPASAGFLQCLRFTRA